MSICSDCDALIKFLHTRSHGKSHTHKTIIEVLRTAPICDLCNLIISVEFKWQDNYTPDTFSLSLWNTETYLHRLEAYAKKASDAFPAIKVLALEDICTRTSEIVLQVKFPHDRLAGIYLAVWKDTPCADVETECPRHKEDFVSDHMFNASPTENRFAQFCPCSTSDIAYRPYGIITDDDSTKTLDCLKTWLHVCECGPGHGRCNMSFSGELLDGFYPFVPYPLLPKRILDIETDLIKLVETEPGDRDHYIALSHCWGKPENHPPKTTHANYEDHLGGFQFSTLPKTFQDAVKIARHIGVQYLWIDSLCIIQDDAADWKREAACMGAYYEYARLTIAAAGAQDCTEGCFLSCRPVLKEVRDRVFQCDRAYRTEATETRDKLDSNEDPCRAQRSFPPDPPQITVLSRGDNGVPVTVHLGAVTPVNDEPYYSPLGSRAWARQEWYLSRRMLFFTRGGISWKCRSSQFNERERYYDMRESPDHMLEQDWSHLLERYSDDDLTYETDRLVALQGIATQMSSILEGTYHFGFWTHKPELLFWMMKRPQRDVNGPDAPSWSWASRNGSKFFWKTMIQFALGNGQTDLTRNGIRVDDTGTLTTTALIHELPTATVPDEWIDAGHVPKKCHMVPESSLIHYASNASRILFLLDPDGSEDRAIGLAALDDYSAPSTGKVFCIFLLLTPRLLEVLPDHKVSNRSGGGDSESQLSSSKRDDEKTMYEAMGSHLFWVLLVQEVTGKQNYFHRIGMGLVNPFAQEISAPGRYEEVHIV